VPIVEPGLPIEPEDLGVHFLRDATGEDPFDPSAALELRGEAGLPSSVVEEAALSELAIEDDSLGDADDLDADDLDIDDPDTDDLDADEFDLDADELEDDISASSSTIRSTCSRGSSQRPKGSRPRARRKPTVWICAPRPSAMGHCSIARSTLMRAKTRTSCSRRTPRWNRTYTQTT